MHVGAPDDKKISLLAYPWFGLIACTVRHHASAPIRCPVRIFLSDLRSVAIHSTHTVLLLISN